MPYPNEHAARIREPGSFAWIKQIWPEKPKVEADEPNYPYNSSWIRAVGGQLEGKTGKDDPVVVQAIRFKADKWTAEKAKAWCEEHNYKPILFEAAGGDAQAAWDDGETIQFGGAVEIKASNSGKSAAVHIIGYTGDLMVAKLRGMPTPMVVELAGIEGLAHTPILADHDQSLGGTLGVGVSSVKGGELHTEGRILADEDSIAAKRVIELSKLGLKFQASMGAAPLKARAVDGREVFTANGKQFQAPEGGMLHVTRSVLKEVSICALGADGKTSVSIAAAWCAANPQLEEEKMDPKFKEWLEAKGLKVDGLDPKGVEFLKASWQAEVKGAEDAAKAADGEPSPEIKAMRERHAAESQRLVAIEAAYSEAVVGQESEVVKSLGEIKAEAIKDGWLADRATLAMVRKARPAKVPGRKGPDCTGGMIEAALCMQYGVGDDTLLAKWFDGPTLDGARKLRGMGLRGAISLCAARAGIDLPMNPASDAYIRAAFSTSEMSGIVGAVANKALGAAFASPETVLPQIAAKASVTNFHIQTVFQLALLGAMQEVGPTGEIKHLRLSEETYTRQAKTRGGLLRVSRTDLVNDDLGALTSGARRLANKWLVTREGVTIGLLNATGSGVSFFTSGHGNYASGSAAAWYLLADPGAMPAIEVAYLNGVEAPSIEFFGMDSEADTLGVTWRCYFDCQPNLAEYRAAVKSKAALTIENLAAAERLFLDQTDPDGNPQMLRPSVLLVPTSLWETARKIVDPKGTVIVTGLSSSSAKAIEPNANIYANAFKVAVTPFLSNS